jgi:hypothetical protein
MKVSILLAVVSSLIAITVASAQTAFTYQGKLSDGASSVNGDYDMQFNLFDTATVGTGVRKGPTITNPSVVVNAGIFYTLWYYSNDADLAKQLRKTGIDAQNTPTIDYDYDADENTLFVRVPRPGLPRLALLGVVQPSLVPAGSFLANWWQQTDAGVVKMSTNVPVIKIGRADIMLTTDPNGQLGRLIGRGSTGFALLQQFNTFPGAHMDVSVVVP